MSFKNIPKELTELNQWVCWKAVVRESDGKVTKPPFNPRGFRASTVEPKHWSSFESCVNAVKAGKFTGIGFVFTENDPYAGIDMDAQKDENGKWSRDVLETVNRINSYTEQSPSGKGIHIIARANLPGNGHCDKQTGREIYDKMRYLTFTGNVLFDKNTIRGRHTAMSEVYMDWFSSHTGYELYQAPDLNFDNEIPHVKLQDCNIADTVKDLIANGTGIERFPGKDGEGADRSKALFYVCSQLVNGGESKETILRILTNKNYFMAQPALERRPNRTAAMAWVWKYTLAKCIQAHTDLKNEFEDLAAEIEADTEQHEIEEVDGCESCEDHEETESTDSDKPAPVKYTKGAFEKNAMKFIKANPLVYYLEEYYRYKGKYWHKCDTAIIERDVHLALSNRAFTMADINATITTVRRFATREAFSVPPTMVCFQNGVVDLKGWDKGKMNLELKAHDKDHHATSILNFDFDPEAQCKRWLKFLDEVFESDENSIRLLQQFMGYYLVYDYRWQKILVMLNKSRSGKGTIVKVIRELVGEAAFAPTTLTKLGSSFELDPLRYAKVAVIADAKQAKRDNLSQSHETLLNISGNDPVSVERKHKQSINTVIPARLLIVANEYPKFNDSQGALRNRTSILNFNVSFADRQDVNLFAKLKKELPGIFNWALRGLVDLAETGNFVETEAGAAKARELGVYQNPLGTFVEEILYQKKDATISTNDLYELYQRFCRSVDVYCMVKVEFSRRLTHLAPWIGHSRIGSKKERARVLVGVGVNSDQLDEYLDIESQF